MTLLNSGLSGLHHHWVPQTLPKLHCFHILSFPKSVRTQKSHLVICPGAIWFLLVVVASLEYFLRVLAKLSFYYAPFCIAKKGRSPKSHFSADSLLTLYSNYILSNQP